jgi:putative autotransporter adhesin-like protein
MRPFLIAVAALSAAASPAEAATRNFGITSFQKIRVEGPFKVTVATGVAPFAKAIGSSEAVDRVSIESRGDTLVVHSNLSSWGGYPGRDTGPVQISVGTHDLSSAWISGSGSLAIDKARGLSFDLSVQGSAAGAIGQVDVDQLNVAIVGTGSGSVAGRAAKMTAIVRGVGSLNAANLSTHDATIGAEGTSTIAANVSNSATVDGSGAITIQLTGGPACTLRVSGSASVSGCR